MSDLDLSLVSICPLMISQPAVSTSVRLPQHVYYKKNKNKKKSAAALFIIIVTCELL